MPTSRYILLDIDGVLTSDRWSKKCRVEHRPANLFGLDWFDPDCVSAFASILERTGAEIVICSSWRDLGEDRLRHVWKACGLPGRLAGTTPVWILQKDEAIKEWIRTHPGDTFVIIDDAEMNFNKQIRPNPEKGLSPEDAEEVISILL